ncbi:hypothetical protein BPJM79_10134 [Bacillus pumilus]
MPPSHANKYSVHYVREVMRYEKENNERTHKRIKKRQTGRTLA